MVRNIVVRRQEIPGSTRIRCITLRRLGRLGFNTTLGCRRNRWWPAISRIIRIVLLKRLHLEDWCSFVSQYLVELLVGRVWMEDSGYAEPKEQPRC
jgi:hypothetical protein